MQLNPLAAYAPVFEPHNPVPNLPLCKYRHANGGNIMFHHCNRWSSRYAYGFARHANPSATRSQTFHQSRRHTAHSHFGHDFGVRRPLRYLTHKLDLDDRQIRHIAAILDRLKTEREQAKLDEARTVTKVASLITNPDVSMDLLRNALAPRVTSAETLQLAVARALQDIIVELDPEQREELAYLLNSKSFVL